MIPKARLCGYLRRKNHDLDSESDKTRAGSAPVSQIEDGEREADEPVHHRHDRTERIR